MTLEPAPREVPLPVRLTCIFGGAFSFFGWLFAGFGMIFVWVFVGNSEAVTWLKFRNANAYADGTVLAVDDTNATVNDERVYRVRYRFNVDGASYEGGSYTHNSKAATGKVSIAYDPDDPSISNIEGLSPAMFGFSTLFVLLFPLVGLLVASIDMRKGFKANKLLKEGELASGKLVAKEATNVEINEQTVYELTFEFVDSRGMSRNATTRSHQPEKLEDDAEELLLYDPVEPWRNVLVDSLPSTVKISPDGALQHTSIKPLILPGLAIGGHGLYALIRLFV